TRDSNHVLMQGSNYKDLEQVEQTLDIVVIDLPNFLHWIEEVSLDTFSETNKLIVLAKSGEEHHAIEAIQAGAYGFFWRKWKPRSFYMLWIKLRERSIIFMGVLLII